MFSVGCAEERLEVPLFVELTGYGPYAGRRNTGTVEPLYCRAFSFFDGEKRALILYTDLCSLDDEFVRELRGKIASRLRIDPEGIAFVATHTHCGPALAADSPDTYGIRNIPWQDYWKACILKLAWKAFEDEEEVFSADAGKAPLAEPIGKNRVEPETNITDPAIRWVRFFRKDGSCKLLIHNHAVHGIADNGPNYRKVSSDWIGAANRMIREQKLAESVLFLQGASGDINTTTSCGETRDPETRNILAGKYVGDLAKDLAKGGEALSLSRISFRLKCFEFPTVKQTPEELRKDAEVFRNRGNTEMEKEYWGINAARLEEMALLGEKGYSLGASYDLQVLAIGDAEFFFVPGELFIEPGLELLEGAKGRFPLIATLANGDADYLFTEKTGLRYPTPFTDAKKLWGYYEVYGYMHKLKFRYQNNIASFVVESLRALEKENYE